MAQLSASQRYEIGTLKGLGMGATEIMKHTGIDKSVVSRELKRNSKGGVYDVGRTQKMCAALAGNEGGIDGRDFLTASTFEKKGWVSGSSLTFAAASAKHTFSITFNF